MDMERLLLPLTRVELQVEEWWAADNEPPTDYSGPDLTAVLFAGRLVAVTRGARLVRELDAEAQAALLGAALRALGEPEPPGGGDTACGRTSTLLFLRVNHPAHPQRSGFAELTVNHLAPIVLPPAWSELLRSMRDSLGPLDRTESLGWDRALTWASPVELPAEWRLGGAVRLPHRVTVLENALPLYIRTGQPPQPSALYHLDGATLTRVDDESVVPPDELSWVLPCGGGRLQLHPRWRQGPLLVLWSDDERGLAVQRA